MNTAGMTFLRTIWAYKRMPIQVMVCGVSGRTAFRLTFSRTSGTNMQSFVSLMIGVCHFLTVGYSWTILIRFDSVLVSLCLVSGDAVSLDV